ncbi:MAG: SDR family oxidoreductase [Spirochaetaceae bacterium]|jgi:NAD(P)-dependent dehydrogenase (short-subunit alcohol dehydrogenase family)|nr:SDR family oxidoreductase [Spirochaetaceae bacterium]
MSVKKVVVIGGGTGAIGSSFAKALALKGWTVIVLGRGKTVGIDQVTKQINQDLPKDKALYGYSCDLTDQKDFHNVLQRIISEIGPPTLLINAAGGNRGKSSFVDMDVPLFQDVLNHNIMAGLIIPTQEMAKYWIEKKMVGRVINLASMASYSPLSGIWAYDAAKAAIKNLTEGLAKELAVNNIAVNAIAPGFFVGNQNRDLLFENYDQGILTARGKQIIERTPYGRFGKLEELNGTLLYLADHEMSGFVTGVTIAVDGGFLIDNI